MRLDEAVDQVYKYQQDRSERRSVMLEFVRKHIDVVAETDLTLRRKITSYPTDLSDKRLADLVMTIQAHLDMQKPVKSMNQIMKEHDERVANERKARNA